MAHEPKLKNEIIVVKANRFGKFIVYMSFVFTLTITLWLYIGTKNSFKRQEQKIEETTSDIDVQLRRRADTLMKLVDSTKSYMNYENKTLLEVTSLRTSGKIAPQDFAEYENKINTNLGKVNIALENYPNLRASEVVKELQKAIVDCEDNIAAARRFYNTEIRKFNAQIQTWPAIVAASNAKLETKMFFEATPEAREDIKVDLGF
ncbi:LemA family protein [Spiroplasma sabaudiense Ar-1343]|uniref:LemA family protein n=1 Tax=Spiroplasma sabaudiense Ar-1343 TaxID=1276257 RepID=W6AB92_9MOLU|nr:LemA family protein [Spiroplasma sabaudiense]AHI54256.1 LemA family protein [Spiroplasma sabaudiense Ar-1343]